MGAVQAQDYPGAKWAVALRAPRVTDAGVERAYDEGRILRTHVLRPTWHFVTPADIGWMLVLTAPRIRAAMASNDRQLELDDALKSQVRRRLERVLRDGRYRTRMEVSADLERAGIAVGGQRLWHIMAHAEIERVVCSGPRRGKDFTYALFDERASPGDRFDRDEALGTLAHRFFSSHGPATAVDFGWWSGLTMGDARRGADIAGPSLRRVAFDGSEFLVDPSLPDTGRRRLQDLLLPNFDEYAVAYKDRKALVHERASGVEPGMGLLSQGLVLTGRFAGTWTRTPTRGGFRVDVSPRVALSSADRKAIASEVARYTVFLGQPVEHRMSA